MSIVDLNKDCYLVKFGSEQDYFKALTCGPWMILDHYLIVQQFCFPHLSILFYHSQILTTHGNLIGRTVHIDFTTQITKRGKFARLDVETDLNKLFALVIELDGAIGNKLNMKTFWCCALSVE
ncbi:hypothetical protein LINPERHAP1_LOCUS21706 [Linum perenne]